MTTSTPPDALPSSKEAEAEPMAFITEKLDGTKRSVMLIEKYDPRKSSFWENEEARSKYVVTPLFAHPHTDAGVSEAIDAILKPETGLTAFDVLANYRDIRRRLQDARAALSTAIPAGDGVPPGMVLVPLEPTEAMINAARFYFTDRWTLQGHTLALSELWAALLSTASTSVKG